MVGRGNLNWLFMSLNLNNKIRLVFSLECLLEYQALYAGPDRGGQLL